PGDLALGVLDLDHVRAEVGEQARAHRPGPGGGDLDHAQARERPGEVGARLAEERVLLQGSPPARAPTGPPAHAFAARRAAPPPARWYNLGSVREPVWEGSMADLGQLLVTRSPALVDLALLVGRLAIGVCFVVHGLGKLGLVGTGNMDGF